MKRLTAALAATAALVLGTHVAAQQGQIIEKIIVKVNGEIFTQTQLEERQIEALRAENQNVADAQALQTDAGLRDALAKVTPIVIVDAVEELLILQRARDLGVTFTDESFNQGLENLKKDNNLTDEQFKVALQQQGMTLDDIRRNFERQYMMQAVQELEIRPRLQVTDEEMRQYYNAHPEEFTEPETVMLREIFVAVPTETRDGQEVVNAAQQEAALQKITAARERALAGEDFGKLAQELSESATKDNGGLIGAVNVAEIAAAMRERIDGIKTGEISEPIRTTRGYQILKVESRSEVKPRPFAQVREQILRQFQIQRVDAEMGRYIESLRAQAQIEWKDERFQQIYEKALAARAAGGSSGQAR